GLGGENTMLAVSRIGELKFLNKDFAGAIENFSKVYKSSPDTEYGKEALYWTGRCLLEQGKYRESISEFEAYIKAEPLSEKSEEIDMYTGDAYTGMEDYDTAMVSYEKILKKNASPFAAQAMNSEARVYVKKNDYEKAAALYRKIIDNYPKSGLIPLSYYSIGIIRYNQKNYNEALETFKKVISDFRNCPYSADSALKIGWIYYKEEN